VLELREVPADQEADRKAEVLEAVTRRRVTSRFLDPEEATQQVDAMYDAVAERATISDVVDPATGARVGHVYAVREGGEELSVYDVRLDDASRVGELLPALAGLAREWECRMVGVGYAPGDASAEGLATLPGFVGRATNMVLELDGEIAPPGLELRPMTPPEFRAFMAVMVGDYAATLAEAGLSTEEAQQRSREQTGQLIPQGQDSPGMEFFTGWAGPRAIGRLWLNVDQPMAFVYDVEVLEDERRKGYGAGLMNAAAAWSREHGHRAIGLNVFAHNAGARVLYDRLGYRVTLDYRAIDLPDA
jgi:GNAT superfamily N-acetyltransferase